MTGIAVVIGNAGIKSLAALPLLEFLQKERVKVDLFVGSGGGAALAALALYGHSYEDIPELMASLFDPQLAKLDYRILLGFVGITRFGEAPGLLQAGPLMRACKHLFRRKLITDLSARLLVQTTDVQTGEAIVLESGKLADAIYASNATFPFYPPFEVNGNRLVDGLYSASLPLMTAVKHHPKGIIAFDFTRERNVEKNELVDYYVNFFNRSFSAGQVSQSSLAIVMHDTELSLARVTFNSPIGIWDTQRIPEILEAGRNALEMNMSDIRELIKTVS